MAGRDELSENRRITIAIAVRRLWLGFCMLVLGVAGVSAKPSDMGIGLAGIVDWTVQQPFIDVMKTARPWIGHRPDGWGGQNEPDLIAAGLLDEDGWPMSIPGTLRGIGTVLLTDLPAESTLLSGRYVLQFEGDGIVEVSGRANNIRYGKGEVRFDFTPGPGAVIVTINRTDRKKTGDYVRDISIVREDHLDLYTNGAIFNPDWIRRIGPFGSHRFMDWMATNNAPWSSWEDRPKQTDYTWGRNGAPVEIMLALANETRSDPWFNMPHLADDAYFRAFAELVRDGLDPGLKAYVEYSNEVWNWQFEQAHWTEEMGQARWGEQYSWLQFYGMRSAEMAVIWKEVFGADAADRLVTVISTQTGWLGLEVAPLEAPLWVKEGNETPASFHDAYAVSGYFGHALGGPESAAMLRGWIAESRDAAASDARARGLSGTAFEADVEAHKYDAAIALAAEELRDGSVTGDADDSVASLISKLFAYHADVARKHGLTMIMYEGGTHVSGSGEVLDADDLTEFFVALNYAPEMGALYKQLLEGWTAQGGQLFNAYADVVTPGKWGSWGHLRHLGDQNPRWDALVAE